VADLLKSATITFYKVATLSGRIRKFRNKSFNEKDFFVKKSTVRAQYLLINFRKGAETVSNRGIGMARGALTGTRIRQRRLTLGRRQSDLAKAAGISPAYLNLIEHNRRRIGGKLLVDLAHHLEVEVSALSEGAEHALVDSLRDCVLREGGGDQELAQAEDLADRFPGWARLVTRQGDRLQSLERTVEILSDRLARDPNLSNSLHEVLSAATAIRSTAAILAETDDIDPDWQARFHRNLREDSGRLADGAQSLVAYLDEPTDGRSDRVLPEEEVAAFFADHDFHFAQLEGDAPANVDAVIDAAPQLTSRSGRDIARQALQDYRHHAAALPLETMAAAIGRRALDPGRLAADLGFDLAQVMRRIAMLPSALLPEPVGLATSDGAGALTYRRPIAGFDLPRFGAACAMLPLFQALSRPMVPLRRVVEMPGRPPQTFLTHSLGRPKGEISFDGPGIFEAVMLIQPSPSGDSPQALVSVGTTCRVCPRTDCPARREPSIIDDGF